VWKKSQQVCLYPATHRDVYTIHLSD